jgi:hypothetical protein
MSNKTPSILLDADVLIHLFKADRITLLNELFNGRLKMLDIVLNELQSNPTIKNNLDMILLFSKIETLTFSNPKMLFEYSKLASTIDGKGERATLVYCKHNHDIIASSNTKDISPFCKDNGIAFLTTLDILCIAVKKGNITEVEADSMINLILSNGSYLCCSKITAHFKNHFDSSKLLY